MKSIHFCTPKKLKQVKSKNKFDSIRIGWTPDLYPGDIIKIKERKTKKAPHNDIEISNAKVLSVKPILFRNLDKTKHAEEIKRYNRKFNPDKWVFLLKFEKTKKSIQKAKKTTKRKKPIVKSNRQKKLF